MSKIIERVAEALCEDCGLDWDTSMQDRWRHRARAAIAAMREPTDAMCHAGRDCISARATFTAMVDEALK